MKRNLHGQHHMVQTNACILSEVVARVTPLAYTWHYKNLVNKLSCVNITLKGHCNGQCNSHSDIVCSTFAKFLMKKWNSLQNSLLAIFAIFKAVTVTKNTVYISLMVSANMRHFQSSSEVINWTEVITSGQQLESYHCACKACSLKSAHAVRVHTNIVPCLSLESSMKEASKNELCSI